MKVSNSSVLTLIITHEQIQSSLSWCLQFPYITLKYCLQYALYLTPVDHHDDGLDGYDKAERSFLLWHYAVIFYSLSIFIPTLLMLLNVNEILL